MTKIDIEVAKLSTSIAYIKEGVSEIKDLNQKEHKEIIDMIKKSDTKIENFIGVSALMEKHLDEHEQNKNRLLAGVIGLGSLISAVIAIIVNYIKN